MRSEFYSRFVLPWTEPVRYSGLPSRLRRVGAWESRPAQLNREEAWQRVLAMLRYAYGNTDFYRRRFDEAGIRLQQIQAPSDLARIPVLTRADIQQNFSTMRARGLSPAQCVEAATGGTTDTPVPLLRDIEGMRDKNAVQVLFQEWAGLLPGDKVFWLWGARTDFVENPSWRWRLFDEVLMRRRWAPTSLLNDEILGGYLERWNRFRPKCVMAYPTPLALFAEFLLRSGGDYHRPQTAITTAEPLLPEQREIIEKALGCKVFEHYGTRDFGLVAAECEQHQGLHYHPAAVYFELRPVPGGEGLSELLVTDLLNHGMPMIRYQINDCTMAGPEACACGRGYPLLAQITGRTTDNFVLRDGSIVPGVSLTNRVIKVCPGIRKIQVVQEEMDRFTVRYVAGGGFSSQDEKALSSQLERFIGTGNRIAFEPVQEIPREKSGKTRLCISRVKGARSAVR